LARNRIGLHHVGFETIWGIIEALYGKNIFEIAIWPPNCESWANSNSGNVQFRLNHYRSQMMGRDV